MMVRLLIETIPVIENDNDQKEGFRGINNEQMICSEQYVRVTETRVDESCGNTKPPSKLPSHTV